MDYKKALAAKEDRIVKLKKQRADINRQIKKCEAELQELQAKLLIAQAAEKGIPFDVLSQTVNHLTAPTDTGTESDEFNF